MYNPKTEKILMNGQEVFIDKDQKQDLFVVEFNKAVEQELEEQKKRILSSINHPEHYNHGKIEAINVIEDWGLDFCLGNVVKYISRAGKKDPATLKEDLLKAKWYLDRKIEKL